ncbi:MAG: glycosyltransferase family 4 protein [Candidatus Paceibacterota bacterium]|jgi:glycosyltransferase involved in cell wall biosynthesis
MKLLIITQAVDQEDPVLGFFVRWIEEFAKQIEQVEVICLKSGKHNLPENVHVHSLGKERRTTESATIYDSVFGRVRYAWRFFLLAWRLRRSYDTVFVHMNPEYVVLGGPLWRLLGKRIALWYTHKSVNLKLRLAELVANDMFTASPEGFLLRSRKLHVVGHGIDAATFRTAIGLFRMPLRIVSVGRITPIKNLDILVEVVALLKERGILATATLIGEPAKPSDEAYRESLRDLAKRRGISDSIIFAGSVPYAQMPEKYRDFDLSVNLSPTGGMDKAVLESMAAGLLVFVSNRAFAGLFGPHARELMFDEKDAAACADKIAAFTHRGEDVAHVRADLQGWVETMSVQSLIPRILSYL